MYGEKAEETEELKMDLVDIKNMYKQQVVTYLFIYSFIYLILLRCICVLFSFFEFSFVDWNCIFVWLNGKKKLADIFITWRWFLHFEWFWPFRYQWIHLEWCLCQALK